MNNSYITKRTLTPGGNIWLLLLICLFGYATLNRGFAYIGHYPFFIGEFTLILYFLVLNNRKNLPRFLATLAGKIWSIFFVYSILVFAFSASNNLNESIRNSVFWVYTIFFYIGYCYGDCLVRRQELDRFNNVILLCAKASVIYFVLFPLRVELMNLTTFLHGGTTALIGYYSTLHALSLGFVFFFLFYKHAHLNTVWVAVGLAMIVGSSQARASMLATMLIILYLIFVYRRVAVIKNLAKLLTLVFVAILIFSASGISIEGQRGAVSADFFINAIESIFFGSDIESLDGSRTDRLLWWLDVINRTISTIPSLFFGMGFDTILVDRATGEDTIIRYPHNSFVAVFGFTGVVGLILYLVLVGHVLWRIFRSARNVASAPLLNWYPVFAIGYFVAAFFSTVFEAPFHSFVFWVISGVAYCVATKSRYKPVDT
ncbi:MAG: O-antigen ligase family protein [Nitrosomonas sp.]|nr:O-antigen ligase family protein [Nitrosomonas sp.]